MDELTRGAQALLRRPELAPPDVEEIEHRVLRRKQQHRRISGGVVASLLVIAGAIAAVVATRDDNGPKQHIVTTQPSTTVAPSTTPTTAPRTTSSTAPGTSATTAPPALATPRTITYDAGRFTFTEYQFGANAPGYAPQGPLTLTPGLVWYSYDNVLARFDPSRGAVTKLIPLSGSINELTSTPHTVYALTNGAVVTAVDTTTNRIRWTSSLGSVSHIAVGANSLWVTGVHFGARGTLWQVALTNGQVERSVELPATPTGITVSPTAVVMGGPDDTVMTVPVSGHTAVSSFGVPGKFVPFGMSADNTAVWGTLQNGPNTTDVRFAEIAVKDGTVETSIPHDVTGFAPVSDRFAWITGESGLVAVLDTGTGTLTESTGAHTLMNQGPASVHVLAGTGWATNVYSQFLVRITHR